MAPVRFAWDADQHQHPVVKISNKYALLDTSHLCFSWRLMAAGVPVVLGLSESLAAGACTSDGWQPLVLHDQVQPGCEVAYRMPIGFGEMASAAAAAITSMRLVTSDVDALVEVRAMLASGCSWANAGHVLATTQLKLAKLDGWRQVAAVVYAAAQASVRSGSSNNSSIGGGLHTEQGTAGDIVITGPNNLRVVFSAFTGSIESFSFGGCNLVEGLQPCFMRAPTDNDCGGSGGSSYAARWAAAGLDRLGLAGKV
jgi:beta-galactosidase